MSMEILSEHGDDVVETNSLFLLGSQAEFFLIFQK